MHNENSVKEAVKRILKKAGAWYTMPHQAGYSKRGVPDVLACYKGRFIAIETKFGYNKPTKIQNHELNTIRKAGGFALVVNEANYKDVEDLLRQL